MSTQAELAFETIPQVSFALDGDIIHLEQPAGCGEVDRIDIHMVHLQHLAQIAGLARKDPALDRLSRHLAKLRDGIESLYLMLAAVPYFPPGSGETEDVLQARALLELADTFCEDLAEVAE